MREIAQVRRLLARPTVSRSRAAGRWPPGWSARLGGMTFAIREEPGPRTITERTGPVPDQAVRLGVLHQRDRPLVPRLRVGCRAV